MAGLPDIVLTDSLGPDTRNIIELAKPYSTVVLLYEDEFSERIMASWAELDRLNLQTRRIGQIYSGVPVHSFGLDAFPQNTVLELHIREAPKNVIFQDPQRTAYKSLLNELSTITVQVKHYTVDPDVLKALS